MSVRKFGDRWGVDVGVDGQRQRLRSPENSRQGALAFEAQIRKKLLWSQANGTEAIKPPKFAEFAAEWLETYAKANNKPSEIAAKESRLRIHLLPFLGSLRLNEITSFTIEKYKSVKTQAGLHPKTINNHLAILSKCLQTAEEWRRLERAPRVRLFRKVPLPTPGFLTRDECRRVLEAAVGTPWWLMIMLGLHTGLRRAEILALHHEDIDLERRQIHVRHNFSEHVLTVPKSGRFRVVPLSPTLFQELSKLPRRSGYVFTDTAGRPWKVHIASGHLRRIGKRARVPASGNLGWHTFRHTFASHLAMAGVPLVAVKELLGHATLEMTMRYAHLSPQALAYAVSPIDVLGFDEPPAHGTPTALVTEIPNAAPALHRSFFANS